MAYTNDIMLVCFDECDKVFEPLTRAGIRFSKVYNGDFNGVVPRL